MMNKFIKHCVRWARWQKRCDNGKLYKFLVLVGVIKAPTMIWVDFKITNKDLGGSDLDVR